MRILSASWALILASEAAAIESPTTGAGWVWQHPLPQGNALFAVAPIGSEGVIAVGPLGTILRSTDRGKTWTFESSGTSQYLVAASFSDELTGTVVGQAGTILRTVDGGSTWTLQSSGTNRFLYGVSFVDINDGTVVGDFGTILRTTDGGEMWKSQDSGTANVLRGVSFVDSKT